MLNNNEVIVLKACVENIFENTGCEFGWSDEVVESLNNIMSYHKVAGYLSQLHQKRYISIDEESHQILPMRKMLDVWSNTEEIWTTIVNFEFLD